jgi:hypothetical protein
MLATTNEVPVRTAFLTGNRVDRAAPSVRLMAAARTRETLGPQGLENTPPTRLFRCELLAEISYDVWVGGCMRLHQISMTWHSRRNDVPKHFNLV